ncbi:MAG: MOSC N-terminal beta barrel domain-containing protein [Chitinophagaceae bacterium]
MTVSELYIYPVKSLGGISLESAEIEERGFRYDRRWMLVDDNNIFMTQREHPTMALLKVAIIEKALNIKYTPGADTALQVPLEPVEQLFTSVEVWSNKCKAQWVSKTADEWFSDILHTNCRLVYMPDESRRIVDIRYAHQKEITSFTDGYPFMMIGQASLDDLNSRMNVPLPMNRFRPNIVFTGGEPYEEDLFENFNIGSNEFFGVKLSERCIVTTIDQQTGIKGKEPLTTLSRYRAKDNKIFFGQNLLHKGEGAIKIGDTITVHRKREI